MKAEGRQVVASVNITLPWILATIEPKVATLVAGYDTFGKATLEVLVGNHKPIGHLPLTLPKNAAVIGVDEFGICVSCNDMAGL
jgi:beta-glucosidase